MFDAYIGLFRGLTLIATLIAMIVTGKYQWAAMIEVGRFLPPERRTYQALRWSIRDEVNMPHVPETVRTTYRIGQWSGAIAFGLMLVTVSLYGHVVEASLFGATAVVFLILRRFWPP